jgi:hypothetical protein
MKLHLLLLLSLAAVLTQTGCVTGRRTFSVPIPTDAHTTATKGPIYISSVTDDRVFQNKPRDPSTPSIDGDVTSMSAEQKNHMIGRQRNTWGHAMGDIALADGDTVTNRAKALVEEGLRRKGYEISEDPAAPASLAISVEEFWAWMSPGAFALSFEAKVTTKLTLKNEHGTAKTTVRGHGLNHGQFVKDGNWLEALEPAFKEYLANFSTALDDATAQSGNTTEAAPAGDLYTELKKLDELHRDKILTDEEFQAQKAKLLQKN